MVSSITYGELLTRKACPRACPRSETTALGMSEASVLGMVTNSIFSFRNVETKGLQGVSSRNYSKANKSNL